MNLAYVYINYRMSNKILTTYGRIIIMTSQIKLSLLFTTLCPYYAYSESRL